MTFARASLLPAVPVPPHDPRSLRLNARTGWRDGALVDVEPRMGDCGEQLALAQIVDPGAKVVSADGSFGGVTWPSHLARAADGGVILLDRVTGVLKRLDGCACKFNTIPHTGGLGNGPRQFDTPGGIASCGESLLVADTGHQRISVFSFFGYALRGHWAPPTDATAAPWQPVDVASHKGKVVVADVANGALHFFNGAGRWLGLAEGFGTVRHVAMDRSGRVYSTSDGEDVARVSAWPDGDTLGTVTKAAELADVFPTTGLRFGKDGSVDLSAFRTKTAKPAYFDLGGIPVSADKASVQKAFAKTGSYTTVALDSKIYRCQWDRVVLTLSTPQGSSVRVLTHVAEVEKTDGEIAALPDSAWAEMPGFAAKGDATETDVLVRSDPGRFLWFRLISSGDGETTPTIDDIEIAFPRITLRRYLPGVFGEEPVAADFTDRFLAIFDRGFRDIEQRIDHIAEHFDPLSAPADAGKSDFLSWLASWIGVTLDRQLPLARRRAILKSAGRLFKLRGTKTGLREMLELYLGLDDRACIARDPSCGPCTTEEPRKWSPPGLILEHFLLRRWMSVGTGRLGDDAKLWGERIVNRTKLSADAGGSTARVGVTQLKTIQDPHRDPFHVYAHRFSVFLPAWISRITGRKRLIERLVRAESPAHTAADIQWVEPRFRVGIQSMIGFDAVIGCYPQGITLNDNALGRATVLSSQDGRDRTVRLGRQGRIGDNTL
ncbi:MAG: phage tail protein [Boseongicola sp.]